MTFASAINLRGKRQDLTLGFTPGCLLVGLSLIPWREAWKYGLRAWRYCQLDLGHAIGALGYAAGCNGWGMRALDPWHLAQIGQLLGLDRAGDFFPDEPEYPAALLMLGPAPAALAPDQAPLDALAGQPWQGRANRLDRRHFYRWEAVDAMARLDAPPPPPGSPAAPLPAPDPAPGRPAAVAVIRRRRSARAFDPRAAIDTATFYRLLDGCRPRPGTGPRDPCQGVSRLHLLLFVHRVEGLPRGLYLLAANAGAVPGLRSGMRPELVWEPAPGCPEGLPCYRLVGADAREAAMRLGCHQQICARSAFALVMLGEFDAAIAESAMGWNLLFREAGRLGQALYLNAQAEGLGSSGIGCFFDEPIHETIGLKDQRLQAVYMFTLGPALPESGLSDEPAYGRGGG